MNEAKNFDVVVPAVCEHCGGCSFLMKIRPKANMAVIVCQECGTWKALPHVENLKKRSNTPLEHWAKDVKKRDGYTCVICCSKENVEAHHIIPVAVDPAFKYFTNNGITLCRKCHEKVHGGRAMLAPTEEDPHG